ncbi:hypothetical protein [Humibacter ginsenosidimutans]|uniref:Uncharacterized protein n=1 Tax=Humibacter ginsenosidimutans TaxID=2599293 RepID=A0A5B8M6W7_9MICO|nr:hypothetical protein [Humibacter ginsenosidimutans]QDZ15342.1 hypothetical protein FPZ11_11720 [Humibacter ginsenosidimutans]
MKLRSDMVGRCVAAAVVTVSLLVVAGCSVTHSPSASATPLSAAQLYAQADRYMELTIGYAGPGPWKISTEAENPDAPVWKADGPGMAPQSCGDGSDKHGQVSGSVYGPPSKDPAADARRVAKGWKSHGYTVSVVVDQSKKASADHNIEIRADVPGGAVLGFFASDLVTGIDVTSECSADPVGLWDD